MLVLRIDSGLLRFACTSLGKYSTLYEKLYRRKHRGTRMLVLFLYRRAVVTAQSWNVEVEDHSILMMHDGATSVLSLITCAHTVVLVIVFVIIAMKFERCHNIYMCIA